MAITLPFFAFILFFLIHYVHQNDGRKALMAASLIWGCSIIGITEILSLAQLLTYPSLVLVWTVVVIVAAYVLYQSWHSPFKTIQTNLVHTWHELDLVELFCLVCLGIICILTGIIALTAPPNNWDSMSYVMPNVTHWIQLQAARHYPTHYPTQVYSEPFAQMAMTQWQILSQSDRFANSLQWLSFIGCLCSTSLIAKELSYLTDIKTPKASVQMQIIAATFSGTLPAAILAASIITTLIDV